MKSNNLVRWETVCFPRSEGGIGLHRVNEFNEACLLKLDWSASSIDSLWANWFCVRYFRGHCIGHPRNQRGGSCIWKSLRSFTPLIQRNRRWVVGNSQSILLWFDTWTDQDPIATRFPIIQFSESELVAEIIMKNSW